MRYETSITALQRIIKVYDTKEGQSIQGKTPYCTSFLIQDLSMGECRLYSLHGKLTPGINLMIFDIVQSLGFTQIQLEVPEGTAATRLGTKVKTFGGLDRYIIDLTQEI